MRKLPELASGEDKSGSTAVCALISPDKIFVANCGDSRAVLCSSGVPAFSTQDHKPVLPGERERIQRAGGTKVNYIVLRLYCSYLSRNLIDRF